MVIQMGIPELAAKHAVYNTGDADAAVTWYFSNMENPDINKPLLVKKKAGGEAKKNDGVPQELVDQMVMMGLPEKKCK